MDKNEYKLLSRCIYTARLGESEEDLHLPIITLYDMYAKDEWLFLPCNRDEKNQSQVVFLKVPNYPLEGSCLAVNSEAEFFKNDFGTDVMLTSIRKIFDIAISRGNCVGIVINPATDCEGVVDINTIKHIIEFFKDKK